MSISSGKYLAGKRTLLIPFQILAVAIILSAMSGCSPRAVPLIDYQRTGGIAGFNDHLIIYSDGHCQLQRKNLTTEFDLAPEDVSQLRQLFQNADFVNLNSEYLPDNIGADRFEYTVTYGKHTVRTMDGTVPAALEPVLSRLDEIISSNSP